MTGPLIGASLAFSLLFAGCSGAKVNVLDSDGGGSSGTSGSPSPGDSNPTDAGLPPVSCGPSAASGIDGTWNLIGSSSGRDQRTATLTIDPSTFTFSADGKSLAFTANGGALSLSWRDSARAVPITVTHGDSPLDVGVVPLALGGQWSFASANGDETCIASLGANGLNASCNGVHGTPFGTLAATLVGQRIQKSASIFGELGGTWQIAGHEGAIRATFSGNELSAVLSDGAGSAQGSIVVKVCEGAVSGITSAGFEFSGTRI